MMMLVSGIVRSVLSSRSTGILPTGHTARKRALEPSSIRSTMWPVNGVSFSYRAISTLWQNEASG